MVNLMNFDAETIALFRDTGWLDRVGSVILTATNDKLLSDDIIILTATVKNLEDTVLPNVAVRFILGSTTVGYAVTNSSGVARFYHRIHAQGVYDFHAVVGEIGGSTRIYVSERGNLLSYEVMSGGDYGAPQIYNSENPSNPYDFTKGGGITSGTSTDWAVNGEKSIKLIKTGSTGPWVRYVIPNVSSGDTVKIKLTTHLRGSGGNPSIGILQLDSSDAVISTDTVSGDGEVEVSKLISENTAKVLLLVQLAQCAINDVLYLDDISAIVEE